MGFLEENNLRVEVDAPIDVLSIRTAYVGERAVLVNALERGEHPKGMFVHVISPHVGGEIRGYVLIDARLHLRLPCYTGLWPELDSAVEKHLGATIAPYRRIGAGGMELEAI